MRHRFIFLTTLLLCSQQVFSVGQAALPTLLLAPGARATGMGEAFVAVSDDVYATFYNPGAMGLRPLSNTWSVYPGPVNQRFNTIGAKTRLFFAEKPAVWAATDSSLFKFDGNNWLDYEIFFLEQNDNIKKIVTKYLDLDPEKPSDAERLAWAVDSVKRFNRLRTGSESELLKKYDEAGEPLEDVLKRDLKLGDSEADAQRLEKKADSLRRLLDLIADKDDEAVLPDFRMPFSIAIRGFHITAIAPDQSNKLWIGTRSGLLHYNGTRWKTYTTLDGLPGNHITDISVGKDVWIGTHNGAARFSGGQWRKLTTGKLVDNDTVTVVYASPKSRTAWIGTPNGLIRKKGRRVSIYDSTNGILDNRVRGIAVDKERKVWVATPSGVSRYRLKTWKKFRMADNEVYTVQVDSRDYIWVGTRKGALRYSKGRKEYEDGKRITTGAYWKHFHSKNGLPSDQVFQVAVQDKDVWFLTDKGLCRYDKAERQIGAFWENLLPTFGLKDLYHLYFSITYPTEDWGTLGGFVKYVSFGVSDWTDEQGRKLGEFSSYDLFAGITYGTNFGDNIGVGISPKFIYSKLADVAVGNENRKGIATSFAVDMGYKHTDVLPALDVGVTLQNMGPDIVYIDQNQKDPIPFNLRAGLAWRAVDNPIHNLKILFDINRELIRRRDDQQTIQEEGEPQPHDPFWRAMFTSLLDEYWKVELAEFIFSLGAEYWYSDFIALRAGTMYDKAGSRGEVTFGVGLNYGNFHINGSYIVGNPYLDRLFGESFFDEASTKLPPMEDMGSARNKQLRVSLIFKY